MNTQSKYEHGDTDRRASPAAPHGLGRHIEAVSDEDLLTFRRGDYIFSHFYNIGIGLTKLAVLALYYRIFTTPKFYTVTICTVVLVSLWIVAMEITLGFACRPIAAWWGESEGECLSKAGFTLFTNVSNLLFDLWIFSMPLRPLLKLQGLKDRRLGLCLLFSIGLGTCAISAARLSFALKVGVRDFTCTLDLFPIDKRCKLIQGDGRASRATSHPVRVGAMWWHPLRQPPHHLHHSPPKGSAGGRHHRPGSQVQERRQRWSQTSLDSLTDRVSLGGQAQPQLGAAQRQRRRHILQDLGRAVD